MIWIDLNFILDVLILWLAILGIILVSMWWAVR